MTDDKKSGILRVDTITGADSGATSTASSRRKSSRSSLGVQEPTSPAPSADRLSVTFAMDDGKSLNEIL